MSVFFDPKLYATPLYTKAKKLKFIDIDFETRSELNVMDVGAWVYSEHHSTDILLMRWSIDGGRIRPWQFGDPFPKEIKKYLKKGYLIRAHNSFFEYCIWKHVGTPKLKWPKVKLDQFYCTQALGCSHSYSAKLEKCGEEMGLEVLKDAAGRRLIN